MEQQPNDRQKLLMMEDDEEGESLDDEIITPESVFLKARLLKGLVSIWDGQLRQLPPLATLAHSDLLIPHQVEPSILELFVDAILAVISTAVFVPLIALGFRQAEQGGDGVLLLVSCIVCIACFLAVEMVHSQHLLLGFLMKRDDRFTTLLHLIIVLLSCSFPFFAILMGSAQYPLPVSIFGGMQSLLGLTFLIFWTYLVRQPHLTRSEHEKVGLRALYLRLSSWIVGGLLIAGLAWAFWQLEAPQYALLCLVLVPGCMACSNMWIGRRQQDAVKSKSGNWFVGMCSLQRLGCFSNVVFAFSAILIPANMNLSGIQLQLLRDGTLDAFQEAFDGTGTLLASFFWSVLLMFIFWLVHHTVVRTFNRVSVAVYVSNALLLAGLPTLVFSCSFVVQAFSHDAFHANRSFAAASFAFCHLWITSAMLAMFLSMSRRRFCWRSDFQHLWRSKVWCYEAIIMFSISILLSLLALAAAPLLASLSLILLLADVVFLYCWVFFSSFLLEIQDISVAIEQPVEAVPAVVVYEEQIHATFSQSSPLMDVSHPHSPKEVNYGSFVIVSDPDEASLSTPLGTLQINHLAAPSTSSSAHSPRPLRNFRYQEPEDWEKNILALERGEWGPEMTDAAFHRWRKNRPKIPSTMIV